MKICVFKIVPKAPLRMARYVKIVMNHALLVKIRRIDVRNVNRDNSFTNKSKNVLDNVLVLILEM